MRLANVLRDIRQAAMKLAGDEEKTKHIELAVETDPDIVSPLARSFLDTFAELFQ